MAAPSPPPAHTPMDNGEPKFARLILPDGQEVRLPVITPSVGPPAVDVRALYGSSGYFTYDPGFRSTASCSSAITYIDGGAGQLLYRGYRIEELASKSDFDEVSYLLMYGELPTKKQKVTHRNTLLHHTMVHEKLIKFFDGFKSDAHPMAIMVGVVGALSAFYHDSLDIHDAEQRRLSAYRLVAKMPTIAAIAYKTSIGQPIMYPRNDLSFAENFLYMMFAVPCEPYYIPECKARALEAFLILHMDHEQNASTSTVRIAGSSQANPYACIASGITALWGPAHGGANEAVVRMLREIGTKERIPLFLERAKDKSDPFRLMGFGHRVYKAMDPRARQMRKCVDELHESLGVDNDPMLQLALDLEAAALADDYFVKRKLFPNVDFYSGAVLLALNIPTNMFTSLFAVSRTIGWITNWMEHFANNSQISRPRQVYTGYGERPFVPLEARIADDDDDEEPAKPELPGRRVSAFHA